MKPHTFRTRKIIKVRPLGGLGAALFFLFGGCAITGRSQCRRRPNRRRWTAGL